MTPAATITNLIRSHIDDYKEWGLKAEHVNAFMIPSDDDSVDEVNIVVSELPRKAQEYGNSIPVSALERIQVQFYYPRDYEEDEEALETKIKALFLENGYYNYRDSGHVLTPDSMNITNTLKFNHNKQLV